MALTVVSSAPCAPYTLHQHRDLFCSQVSAHKSSSLSWTASFETSNLMHLTTFECSRKRGVVEQHCPTSIQAAWTRRSSGEPSPRKNKKSWGQRVDKYMRPFVLDILISRRYVSAKVMHRVTSKVVSVATTNAKDLRNSLPSLIDINACKTIGKLLAERSKDADVFAVTYEPRKHEKLEGKLAVILETITENDIAII